MARLIIDRGTDGNPATGDTLRTAFGKVNDNFSEVYDDLAGASLGGLFTNNETNGDVKIQPNGTGIVEIDQLQITDDAITSLVTNGDLTLSGNGTGTVNVNDTLTVGSGSDHSKITSNGAYNLVLDTNDGTNSGTITIADGAGGNITVEPNGSGDILLKAGGQVGIGTVSSPDTSLHIKQSTATITLQRTNDANTPGIDFQSNGGNVRAKMYMDGTNGKNKEIVFKTMDGSLDERFRVTWTGASVTGTFNILSDSDSTLGDPTISMTENKITTLRSNDNLEISANGTGKILVTSNVHLLSATPIIQIQRTDNANVPGISFLGDGGVEGGSIKFDGTSGTTNEIILSSFHSSTVTERLRVTTTGAKVSGTLTVTGATTITDALTATSLTTNDITSNGSNADITIDPQGTGAVNVNAILTLPDGSTTANYAGFGDADDLKIFHNGSHSIIRETGTGSLYLQSDGNVILGKDTGAEFFVRGIADGAVEIYYDNSKKFETTSGGVSVTGNLAATGAQIDFTALPTSDPSVAGRLWRSGNDVKISTG
jgi:hypothetical protein